MTKSSINNQPPFGKSASIAIRTWSLDEMDSRLMVIGTQEMFSLSRGGEKSAVPTVSSIPPTPSTVDNDTQPLPVSYHTLNPAFIKLFLMVAPLNVNSGSF